MALDVFMTNVTRGSLGHGSGRATTLWKWTGRSFIPGRTHITSE